MSELLIADKDLVTRKQVADLMIDAGYDVTVTNSAWNVVRGVLKKSVQVVLLGRELTEFDSVRLVPLLKKCNNNLMIIFVADDAPLPLIRKVRQEGIFFHALRPEEPEQKKELIQAVQCAVARLAKAEKSAGDAIVG